MFGLDWKKYRAKRMQELMIVHIEQQAEDQHKLNQAQAKTK